MAPVAPRHRGRCAIVAAVAGAGLLVALVAMPRPVADRLTGFAPGTAVGARGGGAIEPIPDDAFRAVEVEHARVREIVDPPRGGASARILEPAAGEGRSSVTSELQTKAAEATSNDSAGSSSGTGGTGGTGGASGGTVSGVPRSGWRWPLIGPITQGFGGGHEGIDIDGDSGDVAVAAHAGTVVGAGWLTECGGLQVHVRIASGVETWYQHLSAKLVSVGQEISAGTPIGKVGATGCAQGSHLHFAIRRGTTFVNPLPYLPDR